jgi:hypothetical protein
MRSRSEPDHAVGVPDHLLTPVGKALRYTAGKHALPGRLFSCIRQPPAIPIANDPIVAIEPPLRHRSEVERRRRVFEMNS